MNIEESTKEEDIEKYVNIELNESVNLDKGFVHAFGDGPKPIYKEQISENNFINMIKQSWTYAKLTEEEKNRILKVLYLTQAERCLKGTYKQRWEILQAIYGAYLFGLGYNDFTWREEE